MIYARIFSFTLFILFSNILSAQNSDSYFRMIPNIDDTTPEWAVKMYSEDPNVFEVENLYRKHFDDHPFVKDIHVRNFTHWMMHVEELTNDEGFIRKGPGIPVGASFTRSSARAGGGWSYIGPFETYNDVGQGNFPVSWQANVYCMDQSVSNPDILVAGVEGGDLFKSIDRGLNWFPVSQTVPISTVNECKIAPSNSNIIWFSANGSDALFKSLDGGVTWTNMYSLNSGIDQMAINPNDPDTLFAAGEDGLIRSFDGGITWTTIFTDRCWDIDYHPTNSNIIYVLKNNPALVRCEFYRSIDGGMTWTIQDTGWYSPSEPTNASDGGARMAVTPITPDIVYVGMLGNSKAGDTNWIGVYRSLDAGATWINPDLPDGGPHDENHHNLAMSHPYSGGYNQGYYDYAVAASHTTPGKLWVACINLSTSIDSAQSWIRISGGGSGDNDVGWLHPDIQDIHVLGTDVWVATDGGINYSDDEFSTHEARIKGLANSNMWGFGQGWNYDILVGGRYHNGNTGFFQNYPNGQHLRLGGAEQSTGYVNPMQERKVYFSDISDKILPEQFDEPVISTSSLSLYPNESYVSSTMSDLNFDPRYASHIIIGRDDGIWKSKDEGISYDLLYAFGESGKVYEIEQVRSNPDVIYCVFQPGGGYWDWCDIRKSVNGGLSWTTLPTPPASNRWRLEITTNPENENEIWGMSTNQESVFRSLNGGSSWEDMTTSVIAGHDMKDIQYQEGSDVVYLAANEGMFYWNTTINDWSQWGDGLPARNNTLEMRPFYRDSKIRMASGGKGIWEREMVKASTPTAYPVTWTDSVFCSRDTISFDCYSALNHQGATWTWSINPAPAYISSTTVRNPVVVLGTEGSYDVTLTITDNMSHSSTTTIEDMVSLVNRCKADSIPGSAILTSNDGDWVQTSTFNVTSNTVTMTAWVKPNGFQPDYSCIVMNDGTSAGFNFREGNNTLAYHWPGGAWWWDSNLEVPSGEWSYVAMVATPTSMTVYLNGESATHTTNLDPAELTQFKIGNYKGWGGRNYRGEIDEVTIWNRSLSQDEIRELRHLTREDVVDDPSMLAYYQFNEQGSKVLDRVNIHHGAMSGGTLRIASTAPVGGGTSYRFDANAAGIYTAGNTGLELTFPSGGTYPGSELVATRINLLPDSVPNTNPSLNAYWIVNNYGAPAFNILNEINFDPPRGKATEAIIADPSKARLFKRSSNEDHNNWAELCGAEEITPGYSGQFKFDSSCGIGTFSQFYITSDDDVSPLDLLSFTVSLPDKKNPLLEWSGTTDILDDIYLVDRSPDGQSWFRLTEVPSESNENDDTRYDWVDENPLDGLSYYRVISVDREDDSLFSAVRQVFIENIAEEILIYPNPVDASEGIHVSNPEETDIRISIYNVEGKLMKEVIVSAESQMTIQVENFATGVYMYQVKTADEMFGGKLVVE